MMELDITPSARKKRKVRDIFNNVMNLCYEVLKVECFRACYRGKLNPCRGYLHAPQQRKPALVCYLQELFRTDIDLFIPANNDNNDLMTLLIATEGCISQARRAST